MHLKIDDIRLGEETENVVLDDPALYANVPVSVLQAMCKSCVATHMQIMTCKLCVNHVLQAMCKSCVASHVQILYCKQCANYQIIMDP